MKKKQTLATTEHLKSLRETKAELAALHDELKAGVNTVLSSGLLGCSSHDHLPTKKQKQKNNKQTKQTKKRQNKKK